MLKTLAGNEQYTKGNEIDLGKKPRIEILFSLPSLYLRWYL